MYTLHIVHCAHEKRRSFYFCDFFVRCHPILLIFGKKNIAEEIQNKHKYTPYHLSFYAFFYCTA